MIVGVVHYRFDYYTYKHSIIDRVPGASYVPVQDLYSNLNRVTKKLNRTVGKNIFYTFNLNNQFQDFGLNKIDMLHLFNGISYGKTPWVTGFETIVPRLSDLVTRAHGEEVSSVKLNSRSLRAMNALAGNACKQLLPWSECTKNMELDLLDSLSEIDTDAIKEKITVLHPPQAAMINEYADKKLSINGKIRFMIVGAGFIRKGGREILRVFERLVRNKNYPIELVIVSSLRMDHYAAHETEADVQWVKEKIAANTDWINYFERLPNDEVLEQMRNTHVGLLPTYADTYGLSVLEFQANGVPVITTNIRALPEMNPVDAGWLIDVPRNRLGEGLYNTPEERSRLSAAIETGLENQMNEIFNNLDSIATKGKASLDFIKNERNPDTYGKKLGEIYRKAIND